MNKTIKKTLSALLSVSMIAASVVLPTAASAAGETPLVTGDTVIKEWKLSFGSEAAPAGYTHVPKTAHAVLGDTGEGEDLGLGFIGTHADDFNFANNHDGLLMVQGHATNLKETANGIGSTGDGLGGTGFEYPLRFALNGADGDYYRVKMELTNLDVGNATDVTVYAERKHNITSHETITAGETKTLEFSVDVEPNYFKGPAKRFADGQLNIVVAGENVAVKSMIIQKVNPGTTLWVLGDSTVTDGNDDLPYFELDNYTGIGSGITKYLRSDFAMSNQGEGGLNATDQYHFDVAKERIKAGDYMWVEYGHNHKNAKGQSYTGEYWLNNFLQALPKYYNACKTPAKGGSANGGKATLLMVGPIDRNQSSQYNSTDNTWSSTLIGFSNLAKQYVDVLKYGGETEATKFLTQWNQISTYAEAHKTDSKVTDTAAIAEIATMRAAADKIVTDAVAGNDVKVSNVAFVDLNADTLKWLESKSASGTVGGSTVKNDARLTDFYFRTERGVKDRDKGTDHSHPNDAGAEALAELFFLKANAKATEYPAIRDLLSKTDGTLPADIETPSGRHAHPVDQKIMDAGWAGNTDFWPSVTSKYAYAVRVKKLNFNDEGKLESVDVILQDNKLMTSYGLGIVAVYNKTTGALEGIAFSSAGDESKAAGMIGWVDNSNDPGTYTLAFDNSNLTYNPETQNIKAFIWSMGGDDDAIDMKPYSNDNTNDNFVPLEYEYILTNDSLTGPEQFHYYGVKADTAITSGQNGWTITNITAATKSESDQWYGNFANTSAGSMTKALATSMSDGIIEVSGKIRSVSGKVDFCLTDGTNEYTCFSAEGTAVKNSAGTAVDGVTLGSDWTPFTYTLDLNKSQETLSVGSATGTAADAVVYKKLLVKDIKPLPITTFKLNAAANSAFELTDIAVKNVTRTDELAKVAMAADFTTGCDNTMGTLTAIPASAETGSAVTYKAANKGGYKFVGWYTDAAGENLLAPSKTVTVKAIGATTLYAKYEQNDGIYFEENFEEATAGTEIKETNDTSASAKNPNPVDIGSITLYAGNKNNNGNMDDIHGKIVSATGADGTTTKYLECTEGNVSSSSRGIKFLLNYPIALSDTDVAKDIAWEFDTQMYSSAAVSSSINILTGIGRVTPSSIGGLNTENWRNAQIVFDKTGKKEYLVVRDTTGKVLSITTLASDVDFSEVSIDGADFYGAGEAYPAFTTFRFDNMKVYDIGTNGTTAMVPVDVTFTAPANTTIKVANDITATTDSTGKATLKLVEGKYDVMATNADYKTLMDTITVDSTHAVTLDMQAGTTSTVALKYVDADTSAELKSVTISQKEDGAGLFTGDSYALEDSYKQQMQIATGDSDGSFYVYKYDDSTTGTTIASLASGSNAMTVKMHRVSNHKYYSYLDFELEKAFSSNDQNKTVDLTSPGWTSMSVQKGDSRTLAIKTPNASFTNASGNVAYIQGINAGGWVQGTAVKANTSLAVAADIYMTNTSTTSTSTANKCGADVSFTIGDGTNNILVLRAPKNNITTNVVLGAGESIVVDEIYYYDPAAEIYKDTGLKTGQLKVEETVNADGTATLKLSDGTNNKTFSLTGLAEKAEISQFKFTGERIAKSVDGTDYIGKGNAGCEIDNIEIYATE